MIRYFKDNSGRIKTRIFALLLMIVGCSIAISSYRSLARDFSGIVVTKSTSPGIASNQYWLFLAPADSGENAPPPSLINALSKSEKEQDLSSLHRVGVSSVVFEEADILYFVEKKAFSPIIELQGQTHIDLGINWLLIGVSAILLSLWMYKQTLLKGPDQTKYESEDIEVPGIN
jgi:hypothetical protein